MLGASRNRILELLPEEATVLDLGGWADPFGRADFVIDLFPYATRGLYRRMGWTTGPHEHERFTEDTWIERDLCAREPYPFEDGEIDFVVCSHTLEDLRDPVWVCSEMARVGKAGYVEVPSRLEEQSWGVYGHPYVGWPHHHWVIDMEPPAAIRFTFKSHAIHSTPQEHFPAGFWERLNEEERVQTLWWEGDLTASERVLVEKDSHLSDFVSAELARRPGAPRRSRAERLGSRIRDRLRAR